MTQLGFEDLLVQTDKINETRRIESELGHLPGNMADALPYYRDLMERFHAAMLVGSFEDAQGIAEEAYKLARRLNGGQSGIIASDSAPGCALARETASPSGSVPLWGQEGEFIVRICEMDILVKLDGLFGIGMPYCLFPGFEVYAVHPNKPFLSETGYRSFLGCRTTISAGGTPKEFVTAIIKAFVERDLSGKLVSIAPSFRDRF